MSITGEGYRFFSSGACVVKGGPGSGDKLNHPFRGNQWEDLNGNKVSGRSIDVSTDASAKIASIGLSKDSIADMSGAVDGSSVKITIADYYYKGMVMVEIKSPEYEAVRVIKINPVGIDIANLSFKVKDTGKGIGLKVFLKQVESAISAGARSIEMVAAREWGDVEANGYYTWARFGAEATHGRYLRVEKEHPFVVSNPSLFRITDDGKVVIDSVLDIMQADGGASFWKEHGVEFEGEFDLSPGSRSRKVLDSYVRSKRLIDKTKGGPGSGEKDGHPFRGNQYTDGNYSHAEIDQDGYVPPVIPEAPVPPGGRSLTPGESSYLDYINDKFEKLNKEEDDISRKEIAPRNLKIEGLRRQLRMAMSSENPDQSDLLRIRSEMGALFLEIEAQQLRIADIERQRKVLAEKSEELSDIISPPRLRSLEVLRLSSGGAPRRVDDSNSNKVQSIATQREATVSEPSITESTKNKPFDDDYNPTFSPIFTTRGQFKEAIEKLFPGISISGVPHKPDFHVLTMIHDEFKSCRDEFPECAITTLKLSKRAGGQAVFKPGDPTVTIGGMMQSFSDLAISWSHQGDIRVRDSQAPGFHDGGKSFAQVVRHEFGHQLDDQIRRILSKEEYSLVVDKTSKDMGRRLTGSDYANVSIYARKSPLEGFAEAFALSKYGDDVTKNSFAVKYVNRFLKIALEHIRSKKKR